MDQRVKEITYRLAMSTPGPWHVESEETAEGSFITKVGAHYIVPEYQHLADDGDDAILIANAPMDLQYLVGEVIKYREALQELFSVTPAQLTPEVLKIVGINEKHREACDKAKRLLWGPAEDNSRKVKKAAKRGA